jgi:hypothetical protein
MAGILLYACFSLFPDYWLQAGIHPICIAVNNFSHSFFLYIFSCTYSRTLRGSNYPFPAIPVG